MPPVLPPPVFPEVPVFPLPPAALPVPSLSTEPPQPNQKSEERRSQAPFRISSA
jgi:hypothetical protein